MVLDECGKVLYSEDKEIIKTSAKKVLKRFHRFYKTENAETQTSDNIIDALKEEIIKKQDRIDK